MSRSQRIREFIRRHFVVDGWRSVGSFSVLPFIEVINDGSPGFEIHAGVFVWAGVLVVTP